MLKNLLQRADSAVIISFQNQLWFQLLTPICVPSKRYQKELQPCRKFSCYIQTHALLPHKAIEGFSRRAMYQLSLVSSALCTKARVEKRLTEALFSLSKYLQHRLHHGDVSRSFIVYFYTSSAFIIKAV